MENNQETILAKSSFDSAACQKQAFIFYISFFIFGWILGWAYSGFDVSIGFLAGFLTAIFIGGLIHFIIYFTAKNNKITLTNYKITGIYNRHLSLNIPIDSISSVSKGANGSLFITCAGNRYNISFVENRDDFCSKLNELLNQRTEQTLKKSQNVSDQQSNYDEILKLKELLDNNVITQEEYERKKKQLLNL